MSFHLVLSFYVVCTAVFHLTKKRELGFNEVRMVIFLLLQKKATVLFSLILSSSPHVQASPGELDPPPPGMLRHRTPPRTPAVATRPPRASSPPAHIARRSTPRRAPADPKSAPAPASPRPNPRACGRRTSTTRRPRRPPRALGAGPARTSPGAGFAPQGARRPRRRTPASPTWSRPAASSRRSGRAGFEVRKPTARPENRPVETAIFFCTPTQPSARTHARTHGDVLRHFRERADQPAAQRLFSRVTLDSAPCGGCFGDVRGKGLGTSRLPGRLSETLINSKWNVKGEVCWEDWETQLSQSP